MESKPCAPPIGIDLGNINSCIAVFIDGKVEIIKNEYGLSTSPSVVSFS